VSPPPRVSKTSRLPTASSPAHTAAPPPAQQRLQPRAGDAEEGTARRGRCTLPAGKGQHAHCTSSPIPRAARPHTCPVLKLCHSRSRYAIQALAPCSSCTIHARAMPSLHLPHAQAVPSTHLPHAQAVPYGSSLVHAPACPVRAPCLTQGSSVTSTYGAQSLVPPLCGAALALGPTPFQLAAMAAFRPPAPPCCCAAKVGKRAD